MRNQRVAAKRRPVDRVRSLYIINIFDCYVHFTMALGSRRAFASPVPSSKGSDGAPMAPHGLHAAAALSLRRGRSRGGRQDQREDTMTASHFSAAAAAAAAAAGTLLALLG